MLLRLNCHVTNLSASLEISLPYQAVYYYLLVNPVSGPSFVPTVIAALHPSNNIVLLEYQANVATQLKVQESSRFLFIYLVSKLDISCICSLVCK